MLSIEFDMAPDNHGPKAAHVEEETREAGPSKPKIVAEDDHIIINDHLVALRSDELRDQMAAQIKVTKIRPTSKASLQMYFFLFVAYCSTFPP